MTTDDRRAIAAGWHLVDDPEPDLRCAGSGQVLMPPTVAGAHYPCPVCGAYARATGEPPALADHLPPTPEAPTLSLGL